MEKNDLLDFRKLKAISDYQFGIEITDLLFNDIINISLERSAKTGKIRYVYYKKYLLLTLKPRNGFFTLSLYSAKKIIENTSPPTLRAIVLNEISEYIKKGRNVFCKHVINIDENLRPLDEIIVVNQNDDLLAIGRLKIPVTYVKAFSSGIAINVRKGIYKSKI